MSQWKGVFFYFLFFPFSGCWIYSICPLGEYNLKSTNSLDMNCACSNCPGYQFLHSERQKIWIFIWKISIFPSSLNFNYIPLTMWAHSRMVFCFPQNTAPIERLFQFFLLAGYQPFWMAAMLNEQSISTSTYSIISHVHLPSSGTLERREVVGGSSLKLFRTSSRRYIQ